MPSLTLIGLLLWIFVSFITFVISGSLYYELINIWIPIVPLFIFFCAYILLLTLRLVNLKRDKDNILPKTTDKKYSMIFNEIETLSTRIGFFASVTVVSLLVYTLNILGVSLTQAQQLRDIFYSQEGMQHLGGPFFIWINWLAMAVVYMIFLIGISIAVAKKHVFNRPLLLGWLFCLH